MQDRPSTTAIGLPFSDPRGERYLRLDDPTAPEHQQGGALTGTTDPESQIRQPHGGSVSTQVGLTPATAESGTEDGLMADTTSNTREPQSGEEPMATSRGRDSQNRRARNRKPLLLAATWNIRGCGTPRMAENSKVAHLSRWMRASKIGIAALQETYDCTQTFAAAEKANGKIWAFPNPGSTHSAGTGFVVHKDGTPPNLSKSDFQHEILIEGRLDTLTFKWGDETIRIANLYAPNDEQDAVDFFQTVADRLKRNKPDILLGDFNHVESEKDRLPRRRPPSSRIRKALSELKNTLKVEDSWRESNPDTNDFTWESSHPNRDGTISKSRLDRIHLSEGLSERTLEHRIDYTQTLSDHSPVIIKLVDDSAPYIGPPRWKMNLEDLEDEVVTEQCRLLLIKCQNALGRNPMRTWLDTKRKIQKVITSRQTMRRKERGKLLSNLKTHREHLTKRADFATNQGLQHEADLTTERAAAIERRKLERAAESSSARFAEKGEAVNKYWFSIGKSIKDSSIIRGLRDDSGELRTDTDHMSRIATEYHERLQAKPDMDDAREAAIQRMEKTTTGKRMTSSARAKMSEKLSRDEAVKAIKAAQPGKSPGKDGIPHEFYKYWVNRFETKKEDEPAVPDVAMILAKVWNTVAGPQGAPKDYVEGLMFLLYKKKERDRIGNYRPITLLNSDYKLQTKALASRLGNLVNNIIHPDQAGFVPGRDILDHVKLAKVIKEYCDTAEVDGCLVALDQEKAYDRIDHEYLWRILEAFALPDSFINTVKGLYKNARTAVLVNQTSPATFAVRRGVRQGDPLSCLLFDLAIEPLAESLRRSNLKGINIPGAVQRLIVRLFADDTQIYLSKSDKWTEVVEITDDWCRASTAKFNVGKTEFLPMGSKQHKDGVVRWKCLQPKRIRTQEILPREARFVPDGDPLRILGGIIGSGIDEAQTWEPVTAKIEALADKWSARRLTLKGRKLIVSFLMQSKAQYLLMTNDPPRPIEVRINKATHKVMWAGKKRGLTTTKVLERPIAEGGLGLPSFTSRAQTARLMQAKKWCAPHEERPLWAYVVDKLILLAQKKGGTPDKTSTITQTWREKTGKTSKLSAELQAMLKEARKANIRVEALKLSPQTKDETPIWMSKMVDLSPKEERAAGMKHLREFHRVHNMSDLRRMTQHNKEGCKKHQKCMQLVDLITVRTDPKHNIRFQTPLLERATERDDLDFTERRLQKAKDDRRAGRAVTLNPDVTVRGELAESVRIFGTPMNRKLHPATRTGEVSESTREISVYTDGSMTDAGTPQMKCGAGVWSDHEGLETSFGVSSEPVTNNRAELAAIVWTLDKTPRNVPLMIHTDSQYTMSGLTTTFPRWEDEGWLGVPNADLWRKAIFLVRTRTATTTINKVKAHAGLYGNEKADELAKAGAENQNEGFPDLEVPENWALQGAKLNSLTFHRMYEWVEFTKRTDLTTKAPENLTRIKDFFGPEHNTILTDTEVWYSLRKPSIRREISDFLWAMIHGRSPCGAMLSKWGPGWEELQFCKCGAVETMEHILTGCGDAIWRYRLWNECSELLKKSNIIPEHLLNPPSFEEIMGAGLIKTKNPAAARLWTTVTSETAFSIWKLRNRERFDSVQISQRMAVDLWRTSLEKRAKTDLSITRLKGRKTAPELKRDLEIAAAWKGVLSWTGGKLQWYPDDHG